MVISYLTRAFFFSAFAKVALNLAPVFFIYILFKNYTEVDVAKFNLIYLTAGILSMMNYGIPAVLNSLKDEDLYLSQWILDLTKKCLRLIIFASLTASICLQYVVFDQTIHYLVIIIGLSVYLFSNQIIQAVSASIRKFDTYQIYLSIATVILIISLQISLILNLSVITLLYIFSLIGLISNYIILQRFELHLKFNFHNIPDLIYCLKKYNAGSFFLISFLGIISLSLDNYIILYFMGLSDVATYSTHSKITTIPMVITVASMPALWALLSKEKTLNRQIIRIQFTIATIVFIGTSAAFLFFSDALIQILSSDQIDARFSLIFILLVFGYLNVIGGITSSILNSQLIIHFQIKVIFMFSAVNLITSVFAVNFYGVLGPITCSVGCLMLQNFIFWLRIGKIK